MITDLKHIRNIGRFETINRDPDLKFKKLVLIFSENGQGKTTLCAIMRSLTTGDPTPIQERHRLSAKTSSQAVLVMDGKDAAFDGGTWRSNRPEILIFDEHFVDTNVYSGLSVTSGNRQHLHELVVGEEGVQLSRKAHALTKKIAELQKSVRTKERSISKSVLGGYSIDDFCQLSLPADLDEQLSSARRRISLLHEAETIKKTPAFDPMGLPDLGIERIEETLQATLPDLQSTALDAVTEHFKFLDDSQAEAWVSKGIELSAEQDPCPFCGQDLSGSTLLAHYQVYFSKTYAAHKAKIAEARRRVLEKLGGDRLARFQRKVQLSKEQHGFWSRFLSLPAFDIDLDQLSSCWVGARQGLVEALDKKAATPLEPQDLNPAVQEAAEKYDALVERVRSTNTALLDQREEIDLAKEQASRQTLATVEAQLTRLETIKRRHEKDNAEKCSEYLQAKQEKQEAEFEKKMVRVVLDAHRKKVFDTYETAINQYLGKFNAEFQIVALKPSDPRGTPSAAYELAVNRGRVRLATRTQPAPSFRTALSSGDRTTLALAFFFAMLKGRSTLDNIIVVFDDPCSSLDASRSLSTAQEIRGLLGKAEQVIILSHSQAILTRLWERADKQHTSTMKIRNAGQETSKFEVWDAEAAALTEYDRRHKLLREYIHKSKGSPQMVAPALRIVLEAFLRVVFAEHLSPGAMLKDFFIIARQHKEAGAAIILDDALDELGKLREYANEFHHDTSPAWQENLSNVNETQLRGYAERVIQFTRATRLSPN